MGLKIGYKAMIEAAEAEIETVTPGVASAWVGDDSTLFVDLRDIRELQREGKIPGAFHAPRGMLEFWIDPESPYYKDVFASGQRFVFYCQSGWRSALSTHTVQKMGLPNVCHIEGGFRAWLDADQPSETLPPRQ